MIVHALDLLVELATHTLYELEEAAFEALQAQVKHFGLLQVHVEPIETQEQVCKTFYEHFSGYSLLDAFEVGSAALLQGLQVELKELFELRPERELQLVEVLV